MVVPAFGFSVGDFIAAAGLITKVAKALKDKSGAAAEYQNVQIELEALARTLKHLEALEPTESNVAHVNAIRGMALTCRAPLQDFLERIEKYESTMGAFSLVGAKSANAFRRKSQWAVFMGEEVAKLRTAVGAKVLSINLLLATHTSESISRVEAQSRNSHATLMASILELRANMIGANTTLQATHSRLDGVAIEQKRQSRHMKAATGTLRNVLDTVTATNVAVMSFRGLGTQLLQLIAALPQQVRDTLEPIVKTNLEMYAMLRSIQTSLSRSPTFHPADTFRFEDVLGRSKNLPYEYFRHIDVFRAFLQTEFRGLPGEQQVFDKQYSIMDTRGQSSPVSEEDWAVTVFPGATLVMSVLVEMMVAQQMAAAKCPRLTCNGRGDYREGQKIFLTCDTCNMQFTPSGGRVTTGGQTQARRTERSVLSARTPRTSATETRSIPIRRTTNPRLSELPPERLEEPEETEQPDFWERDPTAELQAMERTQRELRVFRRVLVKAKPGFYSLQSSDTSVFESHDVQHVSAKFPHIPFHLALRLGKAITKRRHYLKYTQQNPQPAQAPQTMPHDRIAYHQEAIFRMLQEEQEAGLTTYASSVFGSNTVNETISRLLPTEALKANAFQCPLCRRIITYTSITAWKKHVIRDLRPYVCLAEQCPAFEKLFKTWNALKKHNAFEHGDNPIIPSTKLQDGLETLTCPLCLKQSTSSHERVLERHLRQHVEELALFALPSSYRGADDDDLESNDANDGADTGEAFSRSDMTPSPILSVAGSTGDVIGELVMENQGEVDWYKIFDPET